ncbi:thiosulfate/3-mercaptopyruvate sulfurtransferase [Williamsia muralis]|uniref:Thiosulfate/3-mercaptopyruvate sulfurtransferase n=1 Tax=Williamsia marianensis TaxID=85044 RepID=A0A495K8G1_WILMA|nr:sulfurtransferase [Williamsia muralis]RKR96672.1 thiosulfate/3-mercaptopyruvate sulfurtransferase [Williamsia muralis]
MTSRDEVLITTTELASLIAGDAPVTVLDVRWRLDRPDGRGDYETGHIPGAVYVDLETELSDHSVTGRGRHPLPSGDDLQKAARRWGLRDGVPVVVYDDWNRAGSARAWWVLSAAGITGVRILDGGLSAWVAAGEELSKGAESPAAGDVTLAHTDLYSGALATLTADEVATFTDSGVLVDARAPERFRGEVEPVDPVAGHIPGAGNAPSTATLGEDGTIRDADQLRELFASAGADGSAPVGVYCGSGVTAAVDLVALKVAGVDAALFPGSWSQWSSDTTNPVATGPA